MGGRIPRVLSKFGEGEAVLEEVHHRRPEEISKHGRSPARSFTNGIGSVPHRLAKRRAVHLSQMF